MEQVTYNWNVGETVNLPRKIMQANKKEMRSREQFMGSRYICVRACDGSQRGILLKVLGKTTREDMMICRGELFCKDDKVEGFTSDTYLSYRFPSADELKEVLDILRGNKPLLEQFEKASMHINPNSTFWVRDTAKRFLFLKKPQYYNAQTGEVLPDTKGEEVRYRLTLAYFNKPKVEL